MAHGDVEIEIKVRVENVKPLIMLMEKEGKYEGETRQLDEYFTPAHIDYLKQVPMKDWLRLRWEKDKASITYKSYHYDEEGKTTGCDELETNIESLDKMQKIFKVLGFRSLAKVDKVRRLWRYKDYDIAIDEVSGLGSFVEIEFMLKSEDWKKTSSEMMGFLRSLNVGKVERTYQGYPYMIMYPEKIEYFDQ